VNSHAKRGKNPKSLAQVWICSRHRLKALKLELQKDGKIEELQAQEINSVLYLFLSLGMSYYQEGCNTSSKTKGQKCSLVDLSEN
jgi:hypothetical protein